eukprot:11192115-Lingulodinium_polyedra.AAC.1
MLLQLKSFFVIVAAYDTVVGQGQCDQGEDAQDLEQALEECSAQWALILVKRLTKHGACASASASASACACACACAR